MVLQTIYQNGETEALEATKSHYIMSVEVIRTVNANLNCDTDDTKDVEIA